MCPCIVIDYADTVSALPWITGTRAEIVVDYAHCDKSIWRPGNIPYIVGNITSYSIYSREIYSQLKYLLKQGFSPSYSWDLSQLCFPCNCWYISQVQPEYCPRFSLGVVPAFNEVGENPSCQKQQFVCNLIL